MELLGSISVVEHVNIGFNIMNHGEQDVTFTIKIKGQEHSANAFKLYLVISQSVVDDFDTPTQSTWNQNVTLILKVKCQGHSADVFQN